MKRLKEKWGIQSNLQFWVIMVVFSLAGMSVVRVKPYLYQLVGLSADSPTLAKVLGWPLLVLPAYYVLLMFWGTVLGQYRFASWFTAKTMRRLRLLKSPQPEAPQTSDPD